MKKRASLLALILVTACSPNSGQPTDPQPRLDPRAASEAPVALKPGVYHVAIGGGTMVKLASGAYDGELFFSAEDADAFPHHPLRHIFPEWPACSSVDDEPRGNALKGKRTCGGRLPAWINYRGSHTGDSFVIEGSVAQGHDESSRAMHLGSGDFTITGERVRAR